MATGNGTFDANTGGHDWGDSVFAVNPDGTGSGGNPIDSYTWTAAALSAMAGITLEKSFDDLDAFPALLVLAPAFVSSAGALGGILSGRLSSKLLLGLVDPESVPGRPARADIGFVFVLSLPIYAELGEARQRRVVDAVVDYLRAV